MYGALYCLLYIALFVLLPDYLCSQRHAHKVRQYEDKLTAAQVRSMDAILSEHAAAEPDVPTPAPAPYSNVTEATEARGLGGGPHAEGARVGGQEWGP